MLSLPQAFFTLAFYAILDIVTTRKKRATMNTSDHGKHPYITNIETDTLENDKFRVTKWTGSHLQLTLMCIEPNGEVGLEVHPHIDQFIRVESGTGQVLMGSQQDALDFKADVTGDFAILIPAGKWHNIINTSSDEPLKLYSVYGPADHEPGTVHNTAEDAENDPHEH